jgi:uncharacterized protein (TIGR02687 family)
VSNYERPETEPDFVHEATLFGRGVPDAPQIVSGLTKLFQSSRIVIWHDPDREFFEAVDHIQLDGVTKVRLTDSSGDGERSALAVKALVELEEPSTQFLLYAPFEVPEVAADLLLDLRQFCPSFHADRASLLLDDLGIGTQQTLRQHVAQRLKFFNSKDRLLKLKGFLSSPETAESLDRKMLAVLVKSEQSDPFSILMALFHEMALKGGIDAEPTPWGDFKKFGLLDSFWTIVEETLGYAEDVPKLRSLLLRLLATDFVAGLRCETPAALKVHQLAGQRSNITVFLNQWRDSATKGASYDQVAQQVAEALAISPILAALDASSMETVETFQEVEFRIASDLRDRIMTVPTNGEIVAIKATATRRLDGHWASSLLSDDLVPRRAFAQLYRALLYALDFLVAVEAADGFKFTTAHDAYRAYETKLYKFDQLYRLFSEMADGVEAKSWDILKGLRSRVENAYSNGFLVPLALKWGSFLEGGLLTDWRIKEIPNQTQFFEKQVKDVLDAGDTKRVFVIISDAFRYEAAQELLEELNGKYRFKGKLTSQLGVLPSITMIGMAALLPHTKLSISAKGDVLADGQPTDASNRVKLLKPHGGITVKYDDLLKKKREEGRELVRDSKVVYVYHNTVDAAGDDAKTEDETFNAVRRAIDELAALTRHIINNLNGSHVVITADHGFLFQHEPPGATEKSDAEQKPATAVKWKKRYVLGTDLGQRDAAFCGTTDLTANTDSGTEFWVPKGINRFHFVGGAKYIHGGAMLQEIAVPVLVVKEKESDPEKPRAVEVHVLGNNFKLTTNRHRIQLIQTEAVSARRTPLVVRVGLFDGLKEISNVETLTFDSASTEMGERTKTIFLSLKAGEYDRKKAYHLILRNAEDQVELQRIEVIIDRAFQDDF